MKRMEITSLSGLRGIAALGVFLVHMNIRWPYLRPGFFANIVNQGPSCMGIFFCLSGFVLAYQYSGRSVDYREYAVSRFARIYPIYALCAVLSIWKIGLIMDNTSALSMAESVARFAMLIISNIFVIHAWFPPFYRLWNDSGSWAISVDVFFYLLFPVILMLLRNRTRRQIALIALISYAVVLISGAVYVLWPGEVPFSLFYAMPIFRLPDFMLGVCSYYALSFGNTKLLKSPLWAILLCAFIIYLGLFGPRLRGFIAHDWIALPAVFFTISYLASGKNLASTALSNTVLIWFGRISYCFYSFQVVCLVYLVGYHAEIVSALPILNTNWILLAAAFMAILVFSTLGYYCVERPVRYAIKRRASLALVAR